MSRPLLYKIPEFLFAALDSGNAEIFGAVIKDNATGRILGHVQPTGIAVELAGSLISSGLEGNVPSIVSVIQNEQIKARISDMHSTLGMIQIVNVGTFAMSGLGLAVMVAGFAMVRRRLKDIDARLDELGGQITQVTQDRRIDHIREVVRSIEIHMGEAGDLDKWDRDGLKGALVHQRLQDLLAKLWSHFDRELDRTEGLQAQNLELLQYLAIAMGDCFNASFRTQFMIEELRAAEAEAMRHASKLLDICKRTIPEQIINAQLRSAGDFDSMVKIRSETLPVARDMVKILQVGALQASALAGIARVLINLPASGRQYIEEAKSEKSEPILYLPS